MPNSKPTTPLGPAPTDLPQEPERPIVPPDDPRRPDVTRKPNIDPPSADPPLQAPSEKPGVHEPPAPRAQVAHLVSDLHSSAAKEPPLLGHVASSGAWWCTFGGALVPCGSPPRGTRPRLGIEEIAPKQPQATRSVETGSSEGIVGPGVSCATLSLPC